MREFFAVLPALVLLAGMALPAMAGDAIKVGDAAPDVAAKDETGKEFKLSSLKDKSGIVLFYFPKADTPG